jgi:uncharacterized protein
MISQIISAPLESSCPSNVVSSIPQFGPVKLVVIQPTTFCNLNCTYCYLPDRHLKHQLSLQLLEPIFRNLFQTPFATEDFTIIWHAGEPLAMPIGFYRSAFETIEQLSQQYNFKQLPFKHSIQTNGTLINQAWCDLIKQHDVRMGVSLDGPDFIHNAHRKTRTGLGTHESTMRGISYLKRNRIDFSVIAVLSQLSLNYPDEIFQFFVENEITQVGFNIEETEGDNEVSSLEKAGTDEKYRIFMQRLYDLVKRSNHALTVREFESIRSSILQGEQITLGQSMPFTIISIDYQGNFMTFSPELLSLENDEYDAFILGNITQDSFESICQTERFQKINKDIQAGVELCRQTCPYFSVCGGGAPANKLFENGSFRSTETMYCKYTKKFLVDMILSDLEQSLGLT